MMVKLHDTRLMETTTTDTCTKCGIIHDVEKAGGHDLLEAEAVARCECEEHPDDEFCQQLLNSTKKRYRFTATQDVLAHSMEEAAEIFANDSFDFAAMADCEEVSFCRMHRHCDGTCGDYGNN